MKHVRLQTISLRNHLTLNERWLQDVIAEDPSMDVLDYDKRWGRYRFKLTESDIMQKAETISRLIQQAHSNRK